MLHASSKEIYQKIKSNLKAFMFEHNFKLIKSSFPSWTKCIDSKFLTVWFQVAKEGGQLTIEFQYCEKPEPCCGKWNERKRVFTLLEKNIKLFNNFSRGSLSTIDDFWFKVSNLEEIEKITAWFKENFASLASKATV